MIETHDGTEFEMMELLGEAAARALVAHYAAFPDVPVRPELTMVEVDGNMEFHLVLVPYTPSCHIDD